MSAVDVRPAVEAIWRIESARLVGALLRLVRDLDLAEDLAQDALVAALEHWPVDGVPDNPGAWLMTAAKRRGLDRLRHGQLHSRSSAALASEIESLLKQALPPPDEAAEHAEEQLVPDDLLRLIFVACHPALGTEARVALTLRLLGGLSTIEIARAFLCGEATIAQRIVRAKRTLAAANLPFEIPRGVDLDERLDAVLGVIYLIFNEGYAATAGDDWMRPTLCEEALRLGRILACLLSHTAEVHGLIALMELQASRLKSRIDATGQPILLAQQDRSRWDRLLIERGLKALTRARQLDAPAGPYRLQAEIAACHARAKSLGATDWLRIVALYTELAALQPSPVVELNRAVAVSMVEGPAAAMALVDHLRADPALARYHLLPSVRGDLLVRMSRHAEAKCEFERAAALTGNARERALLMARAAACTEPQ